MWIAKGEHTLAPVAGTWRNTHVATTPMPAPPHPAPHPLHSLETAWPRGPEARAVALEQVFHVHTLAWLRRRACAALTADLRVALVAHGLRSVDETLDETAETFAAPVPRAEARRQAKRCAEGIEAILPFVSEASLPRLLACSTLRGFPRAAVCADLRARGLLAQARALLFEDPRGLGEELLAQGEAMSANERIVGARAVFGARDPARSPDLADVARLFVWLDDGDRARLREEARVCLLAGPRGYDLAVEASLVGVLVTDDLARGDEASARSWLGLLEARYAQTEGLYRSGDRDDWEALVELCTAVSAHSEEMASACEAMVERLVREAPPDPWLLAPVLAWRDRAAWRIVAEGLCDAIGWRLRLDDPLPEAWRDRAEAAFVSELDRLVTRGDETNLFELTCHRLRDPEPFFARLPRLEELSHTDRDRRILAEAIARQAGSAQRERARAWLVPLAERGVAVWAIPRWERFWDEDERRAILERALGPAPALPKEDRASDAARLATWTREHLQRPDRVEARCTIAGLVRALVDDETPGLLPLIEVSPAHEHAALLAARWHERQRVSIFAFHLVRALRDPEAKRRAALRVIHEPPYQDEPELWPVDLFTVFGPDEREAEERVYVAGLRRRGFRPVLEDTTPAWLWREETGAEPPGAPPDAPLEDDLVQLRAALSEDDGLPADVQIHRALARLSEPPEGFALFEICASRSPSLRAACLALLPTYGLLQDRVYQVSAVLKHLDENERASLVQALRAVPGVLSASWAAQALARLFPWLSDDEILACWPRFLDEASRIPPFALLDRSAGSAGVAAWARGAARAYADFDASFGRRERHALRTSPQPARAAARFAGR